jgi:hypothetical protein
MPRDRTAPARRIAIVVVAACVLTGVLVSGPVGASAAAPLAWTRWQHVPGVLDAVGPRSDGSLVVAAGGRLFQLNPATGERHPFAAGYTGAGGEEPYLALSSGLPVAGAGCTFARDDLFVLQLKPAGSVLRVDSTGQVHTFADVDGVDSLNGIAFDTTGRFGHRLLVTRTNNGVTAVLAIDCRGRVRTITATAPAMEGGIAVAPASFGRFAGQLIAPDEFSGRILAVAPSGRVHLVVRSGLPAGQDIGVESAGFVPRAFSARWSALLADRATPGNPHPGDDQILTLSGRTLLGAGVRPGDLVVAGEGGAQTVVVRCRKRCTVKHFADGPPIAHAEGHIVFAPR